MVDVSNPVVLSNVTCTQVGIYAMKGGKLWINPEFCRREQLNWFNTV